MNKKRKKGLFVVCEGLDGAGKTTTIKRFLERKKNCLDDYFYSKGLKSSTFIGRIAAKKPSTFLFLLELAYITHKFIKPNLRKNKIVLQDRYDISIRSFVPLVDRWYNKLAVSLVKPFLLKPDLLIYFDVGLEERIKRLEGSKENKYHARLLKNPELIISRRKEYLKHYYQRNGYKAIIDTDNKSIDNVVREFESVISKYN